MTEGEALAAALEDANRRLIAVLENLTEAQWRSPAANAPGWDYGEDEARSIGQVALHTANQHLVQMEIVQGVADGRMPAPDNPSNAVEAEQNPHPVREEVIRLLVENCALGAAMLRALTTEQLDRPQTFKGWTMTARQLAELNQVGHVAWHTASIEAAIQPARRAP